MDSDSNALNYYCRYLPKNRKRQYSNNSCPLRTKSFGRWRSIISHFFTKTQLHFPDWYLQLCQGHSRSLKFDRTRQKHIFAGRSSCKTAHGYIRSDEKGTYVAKNHHFFWSPVVANGFTVASWGGPWHCELWCTLPNSPEFLFHLVLSLYTLPERQSVTRNWIILNIFLFFNIIILYYSLLITALFSRKNGVQSDSISPCTRNKPRWTQRIMGS